MTQRSLREISEAMPNLGPPWDTRKDRLGISIFCDDAVRKALVGWWEQASDAALGENMLSTTEKSMMNALAAALARANGEKP